MSPREALEILRSAARVAANEQESPEACEVLSGLVDVWESIGAEDQGRFIVAHAEAVLKAGA
jgi:hypothetical protein